MSNNRYADAKELAEEIERFLSGALVQGYRYGMRELLGRFVRRHKAILATATAAAILLLVGGVASYVQIMQERDNAIVAGQKETLARQEEVKAREQAEKAQNDEAIARQKAESAQQSLEQQYYQSTLLLASNEIDSDVPSMAIETLAKSPEHLRNWEWGYLQGRCRENLWATLTGHKSFITSIVCSPDGKKVLASAGNTIKIWDTDAGKELLNLSGCNGQAENAQLSLNGKRVLATWGYYSTVNKYEAGVWDTENGKLMFTLPVYIQQENDSQFVNPSFTVWFSPDGSRIITGCEGNVEKVWDTETGQELLTLKGHTAAIRCARYSPDGTRILTSSWDGTIRIWDAQTGIEIPLGLQVPAKGSQDVFFYPDSSKILAYCGGGVITAFDLSNSETLFTAPGTSLIDVSLDGQYFITTSWNNEIYICNAQTGQLLLTLSGNTSNIWSLIFSTDGKQIAASDNDGNINVWSASTGQKIISIHGHSERTLCLAFSPDGKRIFSGSDDTTVKIWDLSSRHINSTLAGHTGPVLFASFSPDGKYAYSGSLDKSIRVWDAQMGIDIVKLFFSTTNIYGGFLSTDGQQGAVFSAGNKIDIWDITSQEHIFSHIIDMEAIRDGAFTPDKSRIALIAARTTVKVYDVYSGKMIVSISDEDQQKMMANCVRFSPDGQQLVVVWGGDILTYDAETGEKISESIKADALYVDFSPDGQQLVTPQWQNNKATIWDVNTGAALQTLVGHTGRVIYASYSPDGKRIVTTSLDMTARVWDAHTGDLLIVLKGHKGYVRQARFSPDGRRIVTASNDKTCRIWNALPWDFKNQPNEVYGNLEVQLEQANRLLRSKSSGTVTVTQSASVDKLLWTIFQILQINGIGTLISDGIGGIVIDDIDTPTPLYALSLAPQDRIFQVNDHKIDDSKEFIDALTEIHDSLKANQAIPISIIYDRQGQRVERSFEIVETQVERNEISQIRVLFQVAFELLETIVPTDPEAWVSMNSELAKKNNEPENAVSLSLDYADEMAQNILNQFGLAVGERLCSINGIMMNRVDTLIQTLFDLKKKVESGEVNEITIVAQRGDSTRVETVITLTD
jgi:WD40 repeat protein